ncbi:hypothetical protein CDV31_012724 [Fusarium ambrosium]|uniref:Uncharacterized protein n=1 Tax=Fusarium ambrosium TaxID=131363 RepID=A0A428T825_9HYPO|nr:hypothetical protein CDV31_012724 [Fusarium ambrosium]
MARLSSAVTVGVWTDHSHHGKTLTLSNRDAVALLAFLATLVSIVGVRSWRITRFILFMVCFPKSARQANRSDQTGNKTNDNADPTQILPYQVILRNSETPNGAALSLLTGIFPKGSSITRTTNQHRVKSTILGAVALSHGIIFIALSILTSQIVLGRTVVSKVTSTCGHWIVKVDENRDSTLTHNEWRLNSTLDADNYVQNCYFGSQSTGIFDCEMLASQSIPFTVFHDADCPFQSHVCRTNSAFAMETQNISLAQLGLNTKVASQLYFRRRSTCAPIREKLFYVKTHTSKDLPWLTDNENITIYQFDTGSTSSPNGSFSYAVRNDRFGTSYEIAAYRIPIFDPTNVTKQPSPLRFFDPLFYGFHGPSLILLSGRGVIFYEQSDDPLWSVHTKVKYANGSLAGVDFNEARPAYQMDSNLNIIGCDERFQLCSANECLPWSGLYSSFTAKHFNEHTTYDNETFLNVDISLEMLAYLISETAIPDSIATRDGSSALRASRTLQAGVQLHLEPEQWKTELTYWFGVAMARLQLDMYKTIERHEGLNRSSVLNLWSRGPLRDKLCGKIKFRSPNHTSLSFAGVIVVVVVSSVLIALSFFEVFVDLIPAKWRGNRVLVWASSENLALLEGKQTVESEALARGETKA